MRARDHLHQGRLAGAVLAHDRMHGPRLDFEGDILQRLDARIDLRNMFNAQKHGHGGTRCKEDAGRPY